MDPMIFDSIEPIQIPVKIGSEWYVLCEPSEAAVQQYQTAGMAGLQLDLSNVDVSSQKSLKESLRNSIKSIDPTKIGGTRALLVSLCLFHCEYDETTQKVISKGEAVPLNTVQEWPPRIVNPLFTKLKEIGELDKLVTENPSLPVEQNSTTG
jgi:hypothetical protein